MKKIFFILLCLVFRLPAQESVTNTVKQSGLQKTNQSTLVVDVRRIHLDQSKLPENISERFRFYFKERSESLSVRSLHPFNTMFEVLSSRSIEELDERRASIGKNLVRKTTLNASREVFKDVPFIYRASNQDSFLARLFRNSIGNTSEEEIETKKTSYTTEEVLFWKKFSGDESLENTNHVSYWKRITGHIEPRYGIRLDYAYAAFTVTRRKETIIFGDIRYHYADLISGDIMASDLEALLSIPLSDKTFLSGGIIQSIDPPDWDRRWSVKVYHKIDGGRFFVGLTVKERPKEDRGRLILGFERPW